ncbi:MAG: hypothetical protein LUE20_03515 [Oscillospiraceae bacterium]|nr:hypothetical protein [Oscillospiraceae bacterium]
MAKRLICVIISVLMIISLLPTGAFATEDTGEAVLAVSENENVEETEEENEEEPEEVTVSEAAQAVQAAIDALPTVDEVATMDTEGQNEVYYQASAIWDAFYDLTEEEQAQVDLTALETLADYFNGLIMVATDTFQIGDTIYASWSDAIAAANDGDTITLLRSVTYSSSSVLTVTAGKNVILDLNGYTLSKTYSGTSTSSLITNNGTLTIVDSSTAQTGTISVIASNTSTISSATVFLAAIRNAGTLNLNGGTIEVSTKSTSSKMKLWCVVNTTSGASTTLDGASVVVEKTSTYYTSYGIYNNADNTSINIKSGTISVSSPASAATAAVGTNTSCSNSSITMSGGELTVECTRDSSIAVAYYGINAESGSTTITGGNISVSSNGGAYAVKSNEDSPAEISNLTATVTTNTTSSSASYCLFNYANVYSGTYTMEDATNLSAALGTGVTVYGGTYSEDLESSVEACLAEGYGYTTNGDGTLTVNASSTLLYGRSLSLGGKIGVNYYFDFSALSSVDPTSYYVVFTVGDDTTNTQTVYLSARNGYYAATCRVYFYQMAQDITAVLYDSDDEVVETISNYSVKAYYTAATAKYSDDTDLANLLVAMLHYGAYGQTWANKNTDDLADKELSAMSTDITASTLESYECTTNNGSTGIEIAPTLVLDDTCKLKFYITATDVTISTVTVDDVSVTPTYDDTTGKYYVEIDDILVEDWNETHKIVVTDSTGASDSISGYSVMSYAYTTLSVSSSDTSLKNLVIAMYNYYQAAETYFSNNG